jgi:hypothetical protein
MKFFAHMRAFWCVGATLGLAALGACSNDPHPAGLASTNTLIETFAERSPRYLDPTASYSNNESKWTYQTYDTLYGYHYFKRPYQLIPKAAAEMPLVRYFDKADKELPETASGDEVAYSVYDIRLKPGMKYAPHPAFAALPRDEARRAGSAPQPA